MANLTKQWRKAWAVASRVCRRNRDHLSPYLNMNEKDREDLAESLLRISFCLLQAPNNHVSVTFETDSNTAEPTSLRISVDGVGVLGIGRQKV